MIARLISMVPALSPHTYLKWAIIAFVVVGAYGMGNVHATRRAMERQRADLLTYAAEREAAVGAAYAKATTERNRLIAENEAQQARADHLAHQLFQQGIREAARAKSVAERALEQARTATANQGVTIDGLKKVNEMLAVEARVPDPGCVMPPVVRVALDNAIATANSYGARNPEAESATLLPGPTSRTPVLTCEQLERGFLEVVGQFIELKGRTMAGEAWTTETHRP